MVRLRKQENYLLKAKYCCFSTEIFEEQFAEPQKV